MTSDAWAEFSRDPRHPDHAHLRAGDADRDLVAGLLGQAYAEGRLDHDELEERTTALQQARTLGELPPFLRDLLPVDQAPTTTSSPAVLEQQALDHWRKERREALWGVVSVSAIVWTIWIVTSWGSGGFDPYFPWPAFVTLAGLLNLGRLQVQREDIVEHERRRLEKKERKALERRRTEDDPEH